MKKLKEELKYGKKGITLISLVVTIIVLLILAGVTIATLTGDNGILTRATEAKNKTEESSDIEKIRLAITETQMGDIGYQELTTDSLGSALIKDGTKAIVFDSEDGTKHILFLDKKKEYKLDSNGTIENLNINFDAKYIAPSSQDEERNNGVIGIGTDGKPVDMDLWKYTLTDDKTYMLNIYSSTQSGYIGNISETGEIVGTIPQYISIDNGRNYIQVTSLYKTFQGLYTLKNAPKIPITITNMTCAFSNTGIIDAPILPSNVENLNWTFEYCSSLSQMPSIPNKVTSMAGTFYYCSNLSILTKLPNNVTDLHNTFSGCSSLISLPQDFFIPENTTNINQMFWNCSHLKNIPNNLKIHQNIDDISQAFAGCLSLEGNILIDCTPSKYNLCFQNTSSEVQNKLKVNYTSNCNNIDLILNYDTSLKGMLIDI